MKCCRVVPGFRLLVLAGVSVLALGIPVQFAHANDWNFPNSPVQSQQTYPAQPVQPIAKGIPGEFETQAALVLSWKSEQVPIIGTLLEIASLAARKAKVVVLVQSAKERQHAEMAFRLAKIDFRRLQFLEAPVDTIWARDFGPVVVRTGDGSAHFVDSDYDDGDRPKDDNIPPVLAAQMRAKCLPSLLSIEGGNLLSNGAGLCLTTSKIVADNVLRGYEHAQISPLFRNTFQCDQVAILEPLVGEPTGHVDMFATFTSANTVLVARMDSAIDPVNAAILDRNAKTLSQIRTPHGQMRVERIPMPVPEKGLWRSFTNVLYFNGILMMPTYDGVDPRMQRSAAETYRRLLPGWDVHGIDCTKLIQLGGAVHCVTLNLPDLNPANARKIVPTRQPISRGIEQSPIQPRDARPSYSQFPSMPATRPAYPDLHPRSYPTRKLAPPIRSRIPAPRFPRDSSQRPLQMFDHPEKSSFLPDAR